jgi:hypothetical protein
MTTMEGNRFRFRGGDPTTMSGSLERLFSNHLPGQKVRARVEN